MSYDSDWVIDSRDISPGTPRESASIIDGYCSYILARTRVISQYSILDLEQIRQRSPTKGQDIHTTHTVTGTGTEIGGSALSQELSK